MNSYVKLVNEEDIEMGYSVFLGVIYMLVLIFWLTSGELMGFVVKYLFYLEYFLFTCYSSFKKKKRVLWWSFFFVMK